MEKKRIKWGEYQGLQMKLILSKLSKTILLVLMASVGLINLILNLIIVGELYGVKATILIARPIFIVVGFLIMLGVFIELIYFILWVSKKFQTEVTEDKEKKTKALNKRGAKKKHGLTGNKRGSKRQKNKGA